MTTVATVGQHFEDESSAEPGKAASFTPNTPTHWLIVPRPDAGARSDAHSQAIVPRPTQQGSACRGRHHQVAADANKEVKPALFVKLCPCAFIRGFNCRM